jgi:hypothetical protein
MGRCPSAAWAPAEDRPLDAIDEQRLRDALTVRERRRVRRDTTLSIEGTEFELDQGFLAGQLIVAAWCPIDEPLAPWAELHGKRYPLHPVDRIANSHRKRPLRRPEEPVTEPHKTDFDPNRSLLEKAVGRNPARKESDS